MIDNFALALTHGLLLLAAWRLLTRPDLDDETVAVPPSSSGRRSGWKSADPPEGAPGA